MKHEYSKCLRLSEIFSPSSYRLFFSSSRFFFQEGKVSGQGEFLNGGVVG